MHSAGVFRRGARMTANLANSGGRFYGSALDVALFGFRVPQQNANVHADPWLFGGVGLYMSDLTGVCGEDGKKLGD